VPKASTFICWDAQRWAALGILLAHLAWDPRRLAVQDPGSARFGYAAALGLGLLNPVPVFAWDAYLWSEASRRAIEIAAFCLGTPRSSAVAVRWTAPASGPLRLRPLLYCGRLSFAIYMYQVPSPIWPFHRRTAWPAIEASWARGQLDRHLRRGAPVPHFFESRVLTLKKRFPYRHSPAIGALPVAPDRDRQLAHEIVVQVRQPSAAQVLGATAANRKDCNSAFASAGWDRADFPHGRKSTSGARALVIASPQVPCFP